MNLKDVTHSERGKRKSASSNFMITVSNSEVVSHGDRTLLSLINFLLRRLRFVNTLRESRYIVSNSKLRALKQVG